MVVTYTGAEFLVVEQRVQGHEPRFVLVPPVGSLMLPVSYDTFAEAKAACAPWTEGEDGLPGLVLRGGGLERL